MRFKTDENVHPGVAEFLQKQGHDAHTIWDESLQGVTDRTLLDRCLSEDRCLLTHDTDFANILLYPPAQGRGVVVLRLRDSGLASTTRAVERFLTLMPNDRPTGKLFIVDDETVRVRE